MPQERNPQIIQEFKRRRARQLTIIPVVIAAAILLGWSQEHAGDSLGGVPGRLLTGVGIAVIVAAVLFSFRNWRCPACDGYLGKAISPNFCLKCGAPLQ